MLLVRHPDRSQVSGSMRTCELLSIATVGLHAVACCLGNERRCNHNAIDAEARQLPVERVPRRARLVANSQLLLLAELAQNPTDRSDLMGNNPDGSHLASHFGYGNRHRVCVYVQPYKFDILAHRPALLSFGSALVLRSSRVTHDFECVSRSCYCD